MAGMAAARLPSRPRRSVAWMSNGRSTCRARCSPPIRPRSAARSPASSAKCAVQLGTEVRAGDVLVRLEPRELQLALDRAESALRQVEAQLGIDRAQDKQPPPDEQIASVRQAIANRDDARSGVRARAAAQRPRPADAGRSRHRRNAPEGRRSQLPGGARHRAQPEGEPAGSPRRRTSWRRRSWTTR